MAPNIYEKLTIPENDASTSISKNEAEYIYSFLREKQIRKTLEVGLAYGCSAAYIISATQSQHYAMDPFQDSYNNLGLKNIERLKFGKYLRFEKDYAHNVLPGLLKKGAKFDFIFNDGGHKFDDAFISYYYSDLLLNQNGYMLFHDSWMPSIRMAASWIKNNRADYELIETPIRNLILFQKKGTDNRKWSHFEIFHPFRSKAEDILFKLIYRIENGICIFVKKIYRVFKG